MDGISGRVTKRRFFCNVFQLVDFQFIKCDFGPGVTVLHKFSFITRFMCTFVGSVPIVL